jgi:hypothetical protein
MTQPYLGVRLTKRLKGQNPGRCFILGPSCALPPITPSEENIHALVETNHPTGATPPMGN